MAKSCAICGKPSGMYPLCVSCFKLRDEGKIEKCEECGIWHYTNKPCKCKKEEIKSIVCEETLEVINIEKGIRCISCGRETSDGHLFCKRCYNKFYNQEILIKIKNCVEIELLDESYEGHYVCKDGHVVKSMAERDIDNYLFNKGIRHGYEKELKIQDENGKWITLHPDFCIFDDDVKDPKVLYYIEYWGYNTEENRNYAKTKKFKMPLYEKAGITLININAKKDLKDIDSALDFKLTNYETGKINFLND